MKYFLRSLVFFQLELVFSQRKLFFRFKGKKKIREKSLLEHFYVGVVFSLEVRMATICTDDILLHSTLNIAPELSVLFFRHCLPGEDKNKNG